MLRSILLDGTTVEGGWTYFDDVQTKETTYTPFITPADQPATWLNADIMERWRPRMREYYYDPDRYGTYLEQFGIEYPTVRGRAVSDQDGDAPGGTGADPHG